MKDGAIDRIAVTAKQRTRVCSVSKTPARCELGEGVLIKAWVTEKGEFAGAQIQLSDVGKGMDRLIK